jgi:hypothetical protein
MRRFTTILCLGATTLALHVSPASADQFGECERLQYSFEPLRRGSDVTLRLSSQGNAAGDAAWTPAALGAYADAAVGWTSIGPAANANVFIGTGLPTVTSGFSGIGDFEVVQRYSNFGSLGTTASHHVWPGWDIQHTDMRILGPTISDPGCAITGAGGCLPLTHTSTCTLGVATEAGTVVHELGHAYGFDHQDDVLSMMASAQIDVLGCALNSPGAAGQRLIPDANGQMCMRQAYSLLSGFDLGVTPVTSAPGCNARTSVCHRVPVPPAGGTIVVDAGTPTDIPIEYTVFNNGDEIIGPIDVRGVLSSDTIVDASDIPVLLDVVRGTGVADGFRLGDTQTRRITITLDTSDIAAIPVGATRRMLLRVDAGAVFPALTERDETNNVTDLRFTVRRAS